MSRPDFPKPYTVLTLETISRIRSNQEYYDRDPERVEREQVARHEQEKMEQERLYEEEQRQRRLNGY